LVRIQRYSHPIGTKPDADIARGPTYTGKCELPLTTLCNFLNGEAARPVHLIKKGPRHMTACQVPKLHLPNHPVSDDQLVRALIRRDEAAFAQLIERYQRLLIGVALRYVPSLAVAEEVVQETWLGVLQGIHRFKGHSSLQTWIIRILINRAITHGTCEQRYVAWSTWSGTDVETSLHMAFFSSNAQRLSPHEQLCANDLGDHLGRAVAMLPHRERIVITLRDIEGWSSADVCASLGISNGHQRVLLHRARKRLRHHLDPLQAFLAS
jgi:RNA polymerase sigma-70 factor, ECF subfamily